jgi:hypothetical protein
MAKKSKKIVNGDSKKQLHDRMIESESMEEIEVTDPVSGKKFKRVVKVVRYRSRPPVSNTAMDALEALEQQVQHGSEE